MEAILEYVTLTKIIGVLLFLASFWLLRIILKNDRRNLFRGIVLFLFFLTVLLYLNQSDIDRMSVADVRGMIFPERPLELNYYMKQGKGNASHITTYYFEDPQPRLKLTLGENGKYLHLTNPDSLNRVLAHLKLPLVKTGARELVSLTGSQLDAMLYRWDDYAMGTLIVEKTTYQNKETLESYPSISNIQIRRAN
jgi:hypothetical protein